MRIGFIAVLIVMLTSCTSETPYITYCKTADFILADTGYTAREYLSSGDEEGFPIYYIGLRQDTICTGEPLWRKRHGRHLLDTTRCIYKHSPANLSITVDTLYPLTQSLAYFNENGTLNADSARYFHASAVVLTNISDTAIYMGITYSVFYMHREMQNSGGQWVKMGNKLDKELFCATGQPDIILKPGEVMISKMCHYEGTHPVACRLAFGRDGYPQVYSNVFSECVDDDVLQIIEEKTDQGKS